MSKRLPEKQFGDNIRSCRKQSGLSQEQTAAKLQLRGFPTLRETYAKYEMGTACVPASELVVLSKLFGVPIARFFEGVGAD